MADYMTPAGRGARPASEKKHLGKSRSRGVEYISLRVARTRQRWENPFWTGIFLAVIGSITQAVAFALALTGGVA